MDENLAVMPAEREPRIALVGHASIDFERNIGLPQRVFHAIKLGQFVTRPIGAPARAGEQRQNDRHEKPAQLKLRSPGL